MRILFITDNFPPEVNAPATRTYEHALRWVASGADVTVITCAPNFPRGKVFPGFRNRLRTVETIDGIRVVRLWSYITANEGFVRRALDYLSFAVTATIGGLFERADVVVATSPQFFTTLSGWTISKLKRLPWVFEVRDLWPESVVAVGAMRKSRLIDIFERLELALYRSAARVVVVTPAFRANLISRGIDPGCVEVVTNGVDLGAWRRSDRDSTYKHRLGADGKFLIAYVGTHGMAHGLDFIVRSARKLPEAHFLFIGDGAERRALIELAERERVENVSFLAPVPKHEVAGHLSNADAVLVPLRKSETFKSVIPSKIFEAAAMGLPILLGVEGQAAEIITSHGAGICFEPENTAQFVDCVRRLATDEALCHRLAKGGASLARAYDRNRLADQFLGILNTIQAQARPTDV